MLLRIPAMLVGIGLLAAGLSPTRAGASAVDDAGDLAFVHVEANVGGASGGHSALRVGDSVYHYQLGDGRLLDLDRIDWDVFRFRYNVLENRPLALAHLEVDAATRRMLADRFTSVLLRQRRERAEMAAVESDVALFEASLGARAGVPTPSTGFFDPDGPASPHTLALAERLRAALETAREPLPDAIGPAPGAAQRYREALALRFAVRMLREGRPLVGDGWVTPPNADLAARETTSLRALQRNLEGSMARLLADRSRPDRARPLLVALARHRAVERSLATGHLHLLDPFPADAPTLDERSVRKRRAELAAVADFLDERVRVERRGRLDGGAPHEHDLARLEALATRAREYRRGAEEGRPVREPGDVLIPQRSRELAVPAPAPPDATARAAELRERHAALRAAREARWHYDLFGRGGENCVTQLGHTLNGALETHADALGGRVDPDAWLRFWPHVFFRDVRTKLAVSRVEILPAHRLRLRADLDERDGRWATRLRESNTLTSAVYTPREPDGSFLFFTDDQLLPRPLLGAMNLLWATGDGMLGVLTAPFDHGDRLVRAGKGALFSVPELFFINIRKGTFDAATLPTSRGAD